MSTCNTHIEPVFQEDPCNGERVSTDCVIHSPAISPLSLPANSPVSNIISNIVLALSNQNNLIENLQNQGIPEAPIDNQLYGRKDAEWEVVPTNTLTPSDYDLEQFTNESADPFVRESELPSGNFIPLTGTKNASPVTGDIEFEDVEISGEKRIIGRFANSIYEILFLEGAFQLSCYDENNPDIKSTINISPSQTIILTNNIGYDFTALYGIVGTEFFNKQNAPNAFAQLGDIATTNLTATPLTVGTLNSTYSTQPTGFKVICPTINKIYIKSSLTTWQEILTTNVT